MKNLIIGMSLLVPMGLCQGGCALDDAPNTAATSSDLDMTGNYFASRVARQAMLNAASATSTTLVYNDVSSSASAGKVNINYQEIAVEIGPTGVTGTTTTAKAAEWGTRFVTFHSDGFTNLSLTSDVLPFFVGNEDGDQGSSTTPTGCATQIGGNTFTGYVAEPLDPAAEAFRVSQGLTDQGLFLWCPEIVEISHDVNGHLQGRKLHNGAVTSVTISGSCNVNTDSVDKCIGELISATHRIGMASKNAKLGATQDLPNLNTIASTDANVTNLTWPVVAPVNVTKRNALTDMASIWTRIRDGATGQAAFLSDLEALGASAP